MIRIEARKRKAPDIGMAPLVDCVLLLLIFFLLTSSFSAKRAMKIDLPDSSTAAGLDGDQITIMVSKAGSITVGERLVTPAELTVVLREDVAARGKRPVLMVADRLVALEKVTMVLDRIREAELGTISIATSGAGGRAGEGHDDE